MNSLTLSIQADKAQIESLEAQVSNNYEMKDISHIQNSNAIQDIQLAYGAEKDMIRNELKTLDTQEQNDEYMLLMQELKELDEKENDEVETIETEMHNKEEDIDVENSNIQTRIQALQTNIESLKEMRQQRIEEAFGYFR